jgi:hypothetical protein
MAAQADAASPAPGTDDALEEEDDGAWELA